MRVFLALAVALIIISQVVDITPLSQAPLLDLQARSESQDSDQSSEPPSSFTQLNPQKTELLSLLEKTIDQEHDLQEGAAIIDRERRNGNEDALLDQFEAKIITRSLDFDQAEVLLDQINSNDLTLLKAAVLIATDNRDKTVDYLHSVIDQSNDAELKGTALSLLNIYNRYDKHRDTDQTYLWTLFAQKLGELGEPEISHYLASKAVEKRPDYRDALIIKGYNELILQRYGDAEISLLTAYKADPGNSHVQYLLGIAYFKLDKPELSSEYLLYAQQNNSPYQLDILKKLGENAISMDEYALAAHYYGQALDLSPSSKSILSRLVWLETLHLKNFDSAIEHAHTLVSKHPKDAESYHLLSWVETQRGNLPEASIAMQMAESLR